MIRFFPSLEMTSVHFELGLHCPPPPHCLHQDILLRQLGLLTHTDEVVSKLPVPGRISVRSSPYAEAHCNTSKKYDLGKFVVV